VEKSLDTAFPSMAAQLNVGIEAEGEGPA
jgi:hypothetical protein